jgi:hypothetical protein
MKKKVGADVTVLKANTENSPNQWTDSGGSSCSGIELLNILRCYSCGLYFTTFKNIYN